MSRNTTPMIRYSICVSGAAGGKTVITAKVLAERLGKAIAEHGHVITTGATIGLPYFAARAAKLEGGMSIGFSPAASTREHLRKYRLPIDAFDFINYTGMSYVGRDLYLVQSSDAVLTVGGRFGSLHEFTSALQAGVPCGVLIGSDGAADMIPHLMDTLEPVHKELVIYGDDPEELVSRIIDMLNTRNRDLLRELSTGNWFIDADKSKNRTG